MGGMSRTRPTADATEAAVRAAHQSAVVESTQDVALFLCENLGSKLTAFIVGADPRTVQRWARSGGQEPHAASERRLRSAYQVFQLLQSVESPHTIRAWFMGMNPQLDDLSPAEAIANDNLRDAMAAARAFASGG